MLTPVAGSDQAGEQLVRRELLAGAHGHRCVQRRWAEPLEEGADRRHDDPGWGEHRVVHGVPQAPEQRQTAAHRLDFGTYPLEGQCLPGRQHRDRTAHGAHGCRAGCAAIVASGEEAAQVVRQAVGVHAGRRDHDDRHALGEVRQRGHEHRLGRQGGGERGIGGAQEGGQYRIGAQERGDGAECAGTRTGQGRTDSRCTRGKCSPVTLSTLPARPRAHRAHQGSSGLIRVRSGTTAWRRRLRRMRCARSSPPPRRPKTRAACERPWGVG